MITVAPGVAAAAASNPITAPLAILGGVGALVGSIFGTNKTNKTNMRLAKYQYAKNLEQWHRENEYNLPINQMQRLKAAGLNPNLVYGSGQAVTTSAKSPQYEAPKVDYNYDTSSVPNAISQFMTIKQQQANVDLTKANISKVLTETETEKLLQMIKVADVEKSSLLRELLQKKGSLYQSGVEDSWLMNSLKANTESIRNYRAQAELNADRPYFETMAAAKATSAQMDAQYKKYEVDLRRMGFTSSDHFGFRMLVRVLEKFGINLDYLFGK